MGLLGGRLGTVDKAAFLVGKTQKKDGTWDFDKPVEVLFNPSSIKITATTQVKKDEGVANETTPDTQSADGKITPKGIGEQQIDMTLLFNVVEEYLAKTKNADFKMLAKAATSLLSSMIAGDNMGDAASDTLSELIKNTDYTSLSILNEKICCYSALSKAAHTQVPVIFYWGNMTYSGIISKFATNFDYFSNQGAPLGAQVSLTMVSAVNDEERLMSVSTENLLGLVRKDGKLQREVPG